MRNIAIIPARNGSKRLKNKNVLLLNGKPLMAYTIRAAYESGVFEEIFVSTDSNEYADIARTWGAKVPYIRNKTLASDTASSREVIFDTLERYEKMGIVFDTFTLLQPTSPLRTSQDIVAAYSLFEEKKANAVISVTKAEHPPYWCTTLSDDLQIDSSFLDDKQYSKRDTYYRINGAIYIAKTDYYRKAESFYHSKCFAYLMQAEKSVDIDTWLDFELASIILNKSMNSGGNRK